MWPTLTSKERYSNFNLRTEVYISSQGLHHDRLLSRPETKEEKGPHFSPLHMHFIAVELDGLRIL